MKCFLLLTFLILPILTFSQECYNFNERESHIALNAKYSAIAILNQNQNNECINCRLTSESFEVYFTIKKYVIGAKKIITSDNLSYNGFYLGLSDKLSNDLNIDFTVYLGYLPANKSYIGEASINKSISFTEKIGLRIYATTGINSYDLYVGSAIGLYIKY